MNEKPILFNGEMVRAVLEGRKTQTRRVVKPELVSMWDEPRGAVDFAAGYPWVELDGEKHKAVELCPYGRPGDLLWVRETFSAKSATGQWWHEVPRDERPLHNWAYTNPVQPAYDELPPRWMPSIHMPKDAARITLRVTDVRVERVQGISEDDAVAEGVTVDSVDRWQSGDDTPIGMFGELWDSINAARGYGWDANPWVWVVEFEVTP